MGYIRIKSYESQQKKASFPCRPLRYQPLNCKSKEPSQADQDSITRAEQHEHAFMQRQAEYVKEHGHSKHYNLQNGRVYE